MQIKNWDVSSKKIAAALIQQPHFQKYKQKNVYRDLHGSTI